MQELRRRCSQAKSWGIPAEMLTPEGVRKLVPYLDDSVILGGAYFPTVGVVDSLRAGTLMRERAQQLDALTVVAGAEVLGIDKTDGRQGRGRAHQLGRHRHRRRGDLLRGVEPADRRGWRGPGFR